MATTKKAKKSNRRTKKVSQHTGSSQSTSSPNPGGSHRRDTFGAVVSLFALSGACGLVYQVIWGRLTVLVFGSTTHAIATVLGVFFLGLALGSYLAGKFAGRFRSPLSLYGYLEIGIGIYALLFHLLLDAVQHLHHIVFPHIYEMPITLIVTRILIATLLLLPPTILMGATVPLIGDYLTRSPKHVGRDFGFVFALNTFGAAAGSFLSAFFLIPAIGLLKTCWLAAILNLLIGVVSLYLSKRHATESEQPLTSTTKAPPQNVGLPISNRQAYAAFYAFALTGFLGLVYEVAWSRALVLVFGTSVYAFAAMLTTYLTGLAFGSIVMGRLADRIQHHLRAFVVTQVIVGIAVLLSTVAIGQLPEQFLQHFSIDTPWRSIMLMEFLICFMIMFLPAFGSGMLFPLVTKIFMGQREFRIGRAIADSYAVNTIGCIAGSFAAGFLLIPWIGIEKTLLFGAAANLLISASLMMCLDKSEVPLRGVSVAALVLLAISGPLFLRTWEPKVMNSGIYIYGEPLSKMERGIDTFVEDNTLLYYREGPSATVAVMESPRGRFLRVNGKTDGGALASGRSDDYTQSFLGMLPLLYAPDAEQALVVGLGTGMTLNGILANEKLSVDCIEISPAVAEASRYFDEANGDALKSPKVNLRLLDGRTWLSAMPKTYDVIISEPSHPWQTGNANLFTEDFFKETTRRLNPGGIFCQWLPYYQMDKEHFQILLNTVHQSYPYINVWVVYSDAIVIGSMEPLEMDWPSIQGLTERTSYAELMKSLRIHSLQELLSFFYLDTPALEKFIGETSALNTDNHPIIEYAAPKYLLQRQKGDTLFDILEQSLDAKLSVRNYSEAFGLERDRVSRRSKHFRAWGIPDKVYTLMMSNY